MQTAITVENVNMNFNMTKERIDSIKEYFVKLVKGKLLYSEFTALSNVSFSVKKGEVFGIIGLNGSGKSTLLKVISGILKPTTGNVSVNGNISPLIELGAGFDMELTARENIYLNGYVLGYTREYITEKFDDIVEFSELREFLDVPIKNFSSGMIARLGFSIATIVKPDILIVDEILAVGDYKFQEKCENRIKEMMEGGTTVVIVSHSIDQIQRLCDRVLWLEQGKIKGIGEVDAMCKEYQGV
ncbi:MAG: ABC transporter ATP-binding protein [Clostridia bacterium]|nr:ABC transporter ATP-binding protein [Clostridia bacterium]